MQVIHSKHCWELFILNRSLPALAGPDLQYGPGFGLAGMMLSWEQDPIGGRHKYVYMWAFPFCTCNVTTNQSWTFVRSRDKFPESFSTQLFRQSPVARNALGDEAAHIPTSAMGPMWGLGGE